MQLLSTQELMMAEEPMMSEIRKRTQAYSLPTLMATMLVNGLLSAMQEEPSEPSEPEPLPPEVLPPSGLNPMLPPMGGLTTIEAASVEEAEEPVLIEEVVEEETVVVEEEPVAEINIEAIQNRLNRDRGLGGNNFGGFGV